MASPATSCSWYRKTDPNLELLDRIRYRDSVGRSQNGVLPRDMRTMTYGWPIVFLMVAIAWSLVLASDAPGSAPAASRELRMDLVTKISIGSATRAGVAKLLGRPWRTVHYGDCNTVEYQELWEYWGHDVTGSFKITIEFNEEGMAGVVARIVLTGGLVVLAAAPAPESSNNTKEEEQD